MVINITIRCPYDDSRVCLRQGCENCEVKHEAYMHIPEDLCHWCGGDLTPDHRCPDIEVKHNGR